ncbi:hypothetical protein SGLAM104S_02885 [Streptomyces glaucescens]
MSSTATKRVTPRPLHGHVVGVRFVHGDAGGGAAQVGGASYGFGEAFLADGFEDVVDRLEVEGLDGEVLVGGDEDDQRGAGEAGEQPGQVESVEAGHLDVEEDHVDRLGTVGAGLQGAVDPPQRLGRVAGALGAADAGVGVQEVEEFLQGGAFVVDGQGAQHEPGV